MKSPQPQGEYLDLVFEGRNKAYGAYRLRKTEDRHTIIGFVAAVLLVMLLLSVPLVLYRVQQRRAAQAPVLQERIVTFSQLSAPPPIEQPAIPPEIQTVAQASRAYLPPVVKPDKEVPDKVLMPTVEELSFQQPGSVTAPGDSFVWLPTPPPEPAAKPGDPEPEQKSEPKNPPVSKPDVKPADRIETKSKIKPKAGPMPEPSTEIKSKTDAAPAVTEQP